MFVKESPKYARRNMQKLLSVIDDLSVVKQSRVVKANRSMLF